MTDYSQEFDEGVDRLYEVMESEGLPQPEYRTQAFMLSATIRNTKTDGNLWATPKATSQATPQATPQAEQILTFCMTARTRNEIAEHFGVKDPKFFAKKHIKPLLKSGALRMTIPNKPTSPAQKICYGGKAWIKRSYSYFDLRGMNQIEPKRTFINPNPSVKL